MLNKTGARKTTQPNTRAAHWSPIGRPARPLPLQLAVVVVVVVVIVVAKQPEVVPLTKTI